MTTITITDKNTTSFINQFFLKENAIQVITLPPLVTEYYFVVVGGGGASSNNGGDSGGHGCVITAVCDFSSQFKAIPTLPLPYTFNNSSSFQVLNICVGGGGQFGQTGAGGGLSQVWDPIAKSANQQTINIIAGGGGGAGANYSDLATNGGGNAGLGPDVPGSNGNGPTYLFGNGNWGGIGGGIPSTILTNLTAVINGGGSGSSDGGAGGDWTGIFTQNGDSGKGSGYNFPDYFTGGSGGGAAAFNGITGSSVYEKGQGQGGFNGGGGRGDGSNTQQGGGGGGAGFAGGGGGGGAILNSGGGGGGGSSVAFGPALSTTTPTTQFPVVPNVGTNRFNFTGNANKDTVAYYVSAPYAGTNATGATEVYGQGGVGGGDGQAGGDGYVLVGWNTIPIPNNLYTSTSSIYQIFIQWLIADLIAHPAVTGGIKAQPVDVNTSIVYKTYGPISSWDTSKVTNMSNLFNVNFWKSKFPQLATSAVSVGGTTYLTQLTNSLSAFNNPDILNWDTSSVTDMSYMFYGATGFNQNIFSHWDTSSVTNMSYMFYGATAFNSPMTPTPTSTWNTSIVETMNCMFYGATTFNQDISGWDTGKVTNMASMFYGASNFNNGVTSPTPSSTINNWNTSKVNSMNAMFGGQNTPTPSPSSSNFTTHFNQDISGWDVSKAYNMSDMFMHSAFNQDISGWKLWTPTPTMTPSMTPSGTPSSTPTQSPILNASGIFFESGVSQIVNNQTTTSNNNIYNKWSKPPNNIPLTWLTYQFDLNKPSPTPTPTPTIEDESTTFAPTTFAPTPTPTPKHNTPTPTPKHNTPTPTPNTFNVTNNSAGSYIINGHSNPTLSMHEGQIYTFNINAPGHPFWIKTVLSTGKENVYNMGIINNGTDYGTITFNVPYSTPSTLYYNCEYHSSMAGTINVPTPKHTPKNTLVHTPTPTASTVPTELSYSFNDGRVTMRDESGRAINTPVKISCNIDFSISF